MEIRVNEYLNNIKLTYIHKSSRAFGVYAFKVDNSLYSFKILGNCVKGTRILLMTIW